MEHTDKRQQFPLWKLFNITNRTIAKFTTVGVRNFELPRNPR